MHPSAGALCSRTRTAAVGTARWRSGDLLVPVDRSPASGTALEWALAVLREFSRTTALAWGRPYLPPRGRSQSSCCASRLPKPSAIGAPGAHDSIPPSRSCVTGSTGWSPSRALASDCASQPNEDISSNAAGEALRNGRPALIVPYTARRDDTPAGWGGWNGRARRPGSPRCAPFLVPEQTTVLWSTPQGPGGGWLSHPSRPRRRVESSQRG